MSSFKLTSLEGSGWVWIVNALLQPWTNLVVLFNQLESCGPEVEPCQFHHHYGVLHRLDYIVYIHNTKLGRTTAYGVQSTPF